MTGGVPEQWTVSAADGTALHFGSTANSRLDAPKYPDNTVVRLGWFLDHQEDRSGNYFNVTYKTTTDATVGTREPLRIDYTGGPGAGANRAVLFEYKDATPRKDQVLAFVHGMEVLVAERLTGIRMIAPAAAGQAPSTVRSYQIGYEVSPSSGRSRIHTISLCDVYDKCLPPTTFSYADATPAFDQLDSGVIGEDLARFNPASARTRGFFFTDVNGDGRDDLVYFAAGHWRVRLSSGTALMPTPLVQTRVPGTVVGGEQVPFARVFDIDGDGLVDLLADDCTRRPRPPGACRASTSRRRRRRPTRGPTSATPRPATAAPSRSPAMGPTRPGPRPSSI